MFRLLAHLPRANAAVLRHLFSSLYAISRNASYNQMTTSKLALCITPSLLCVWRSTSTSPALEGELRRKVMRYPVCMCWGAQSHWESESQDLHSDEPFFFFFLTVKTSILQCQVTYSVLGIVEGWGVMQEIDSSELLLSYVGNRRVIWLKHGERRSSCNMIEGNQVLVVGQSKVQFCLCHWEPCKLEPSFLHGFLSWVMAVVIIVVSSGQQWHCLVCLGKMSTLLLPPVTFIHLLWLIQRNVCVQFHLCYWNVKVNQGFWSIVVGP